MPTRIAILGSTGSIGRQALAVIEARDDLTVCALGARDSWQLLGEQAVAHRPQAVAIAEPHRDDLAEALPPGTKIVCGEDAMSELIAATEPDVVLTAVVGAVGLSATLTAIEHGCTLALANKETLVCAGSIVIPAARAAGVVVLPVDSEHSGLLQCMASGRREEIRRAIITSSGGALRDLDDQAAAEATVEQALAHPNWAMGPKITIDSATLMNKALEVIEAHWLFDLPAEQIDVVIHPQSIVHAMVEFQDGSTMAQLARPDMRGPIAYALQYPHRPAVEGDPLDLAGIGELTFRPAEGRFARPVELAARAIRDGGAAGAVLNAANEAAVEAFLGGRIRFGRIVELVEAALHRWDATTARKKPTGSENPPADDRVTLEALLDADAWAREEINKQ
ncbi:MAG: 1-deoxy-D-xylulose-5-phosphate reductoisomerase [Planctomycetes bacterium]|jgi:1-deoxy-D-xylulose-5-phosphate reductoisomerase|nr:1-deoxy-D-xylulose-5-phosphate reductoisomerase [Phycisphaerae bacterium]NBB95492.1 1-deoxy-D-xylulose-5-phosphate reductoisomerase [Planctomycetota bacterium]